jgi:hypothetical protein
MKSQEVGPPDTGWTVFCLTFAGGAVGALIGLVLALLGCKFLPIDTENSFVLLFLGSPVATIVGFFGGTFAGHWLGKKFGELKRRSKKKDKVTASNRF